MFPRIVRNLIISATLFTIYLTSTVFANDRTSAKIDTVHLRAVMNFGEKGRVYDVKNTVAAEIQDDLRNVFGFLKSYESLVSVDVVEVAEGRVGEGVQKEIMKLVSSIVGMSTGAAKVIVNATIEINGKTVPLMGAVNGIKDKELISKAKEAIDKMTEAVQHGILTNIGTNGTLDNIGVTLVRMGAEGTVKKTIQGDRESYSVEVNIGEKFGNGKIIIGISTDNVDGTTQTADGSLDSISLVNAADYKRPIVDSRTIGLITLEEAKDADINYQREAPEQGAAEGALFTETGKGDVVSWNLYKNADNIRKKLGLEWSEFKISLGAKYIASDKPNRWNNFVALCKANGLKDENLIFTNLYEIGGGDLVASGKAHMATSAVSVETLIGSQLQYGDRKLIGFLAFGTSDGLDSSVPDLTKAWDFEGTSSGKEDKAVHEKFEILPGNVHVYRSDEFVSEPGMVVYSGINGLKSAGVDGVKKDENMVYVTTRIHLPNGGVYDAKITIAKDAVFAGLWERLNSGKFDDRRDAVLELSKIGVRAVPVLISGLNNEVKEGEVFAPQSTLNDMIKEALVSMGKDAVKGIVDNLNNPNPFVRRELVAVLGKIKDPSAVTDIIKMLKVENEDVRAMAAGVLGDIGSPEAIDALKDAAKDDKSKFVSSVAIDSLAIIAKTVRVNQ